MKTRSIYLFTIVFGLLLSSCVNNNEQSNNGADNTANDTTGFYEARDLQGLSVFIIGNSTYDQVLKQLKSEFKNDKRYYFYSDIDESKYDTLITYLEEDILKRKIFGCPDFKTIEISKYYIGDIEASYLKLDFFKDTLFNIKCWQNDEIEDGFKSKYGKGRVDNNSVWKTPNGETNIRPENDEILRKSQLLKIDEKLIWQNFNVIAVSQTYCRYNYDGEKYLGADNSSSNSFLEISTKDTLTKKEMELCKKNAERIKEKLINEKRKKSIEDL